MNNDQLITAAGMEFEPPEWEIEREKVYIAKLMELNQAIELWEAQISTYSEYLALDKAEKAQLIAEHDGKKL